MLSFSRPEISAYIAHGKVRSGYGDRLRLHRMHRGLTYRELAKMLEVDPGSVYSGEVGERRPDMRLRKVIERFLNWADSWFQE